MILSKGTENLMFDAPHVRHVVGGRIAGPLRGNHQAEAAYDA